MLTVEKTLASRPRKEKKVPQHLIYEIMDGKPLYRRGYRDVLRKLKKTEDIMGASSQQGAVIGYLLRILFANFDDENFEILTNETGIHLDKNNNLSGDILIFSPPLEKLTVHYVNTPPLVNVEVDVSIDLEDLEELEYIRLKTQKLLNFGVARVIWIMTFSKTVIVATPNADWQWMDWSKDVEIWQGVTVNIGAFLRKRGVDTEGSL